MNENNFDKKIIFPFVTHGGGGSSNSFNDIKGICNTAKVLEGLSVYGSPDKSYKNEVEKCINK